MMLPRGLRIIAWLRVALQGGGAQWRNPGGRSKQRTIRRMTGSHRFDWLVIAAISHGCASHASLTACVVTGGMSLAIGGGACTQHIRASHNDRRMRHERRSQREPQPFRTSAAWTVVARPLHPEMVAARAVWRVAAHLSACVFRPALEQSPEADIPQRANK